MYALGFINYLTQKLISTSSPLKAHRDTGRTAMGGLNVCLSVLKDWRLRQNAIRTLENLPDATLRDIGVMRFEIEERVDAALESSTDRNTDLAPPSHAHLGALGCG